LATVVFIAYYAYGDESDSEVDWGNENDCWNDGLNFEALEKASRQDSDGYYAKLVAIRNRETNRAVSDWLASL
jgi:hypothetical protein